MMREKMVHSHDHAESQMNVAKYAEGGGGKLDSPPPLVALLFISIHNGSIKTLVWATIMKID